MKCIGCENVLVYILKMAFTREDFHKKKMLYHLLLYTRLSRLSRTADRRHWRKIAKLDMQADRHYMKYHDYMAKVKIDEANSEIAQNYNHFILNETDG